MQPVARQQLLHGAGRPAQPRPGTCVFLTSSPAITAERYGSSRRLKIHRWLSMTVGRPATTVIRIKLHGIDRERGGIPVPGRDRKAEHRPAYEGGLELTVAATDRASLLCGFPS
jgi:hypothetical protein